MRLLRQQPAADVWIDKRRQVLTRRAGCDSVFAMLKEMTMATTYEVHEGYPSWHQQRAGQISAAATVGFTTREAAEKLAAGLKAHHPTLRVFIIEHRSSDGR